MEKLELGHLDDLPSGQMMEVPLTPKSKRARRWQPSPEPSSSSQSHSLGGQVGIPPSPGLSECGGSTTSTPKSKFPRRRPTARRVLIKSEGVEYFNYGSDPESSSGGEDDGHVIRNIVPRSLAFELETPMDDVVPDVSLPEEPLDVKDGKATHNLSFYDFKWRAFPDPAPSPDSRREIFSGAGVGPTVSISDPYEIFVKIFDRDFVGRIADETNKYAEQLATKLMARGQLGPRSRISEWRDTCTNELYVYFGIILAMGVIVKTRLPEYWCNSASIFSTPGFRACMSLRRFQALNSCLHFADNENMHSLNLNASEAKLYKIQPVLDHLNDKFQSLFNLNRNISLDESLLQWSGWLNISQLIPNKKAQRGVKSYAVCDSATGYLWRFELHSLKSPHPTPDPLDPVTAHIPALVLKLVSGLEGKGHTLWMDNYYNSPALARKLKTLGFDCVGTLRTNRQFVPAELNSLTKINMKPGQIAGCTSGDVDVLVWRDQNRVAMISTYHGNKVFRDGLTIKPIIAGDYNVCMGGVDKKDQMLAMYPVERKRTKVWYKKVFRHFLNVSVLNAYIIHTQVPKSPKIPHRDFRQQLIEQLLSKHKTPIESQHNAPGAIPTDVSEAKAADHYPDLLPPFGIDSNTPNRLLRRVCSVCKKRTQYTCAGCSVAVCVIPCFKNLHKPRSSPPSKASSLSPST